LQRFRPTADNHDARTGGYETLRHRQSKSRTAAGDQGVFVGKAKYFSKVRCYFAHVS
jgi:hypothetical protein